MQSANFNYPKTRRDETFIRENGIAEPYHWLEDPESMETKDWVDTQNDMFYKYLSKFNGIENIKTGLTDLFNYPTVGGFTSRGNTLFFRKNDGLQNQPVYYTQEGLDGTPTVLLDPNTLSSDGTVSIGSISISPSGKLFAYTLSRSGSDWKTVHFRKVDSRQDLPDVLNWVKFSGLEWVENETGFVYSKYPKPVEVDNIDSEKAGAETQKNQFHNVFYHKFGTDPEKDVLIYEDKDHPDYFHNGSVTSDDKYLVLTIWQGTSDSKISIIEVESFAEGKTKLVQMTDNFDIRYDYLGNHGQTLYFKTPDGAPKYKIISVDAKNPSKDSWKTVIGEKEQSIEDVGIVDEKYFIVQYCEHGYHILQAYKLNGEFIREIPIAKYGYIIFSTYERNKDVFIVYQSLNRAETPYKYDVETDTLTPFMEPKFKALDLNDFEVTQKFYESKDGTRVPMFILTKKGRTLDGNSPCLLYGYGGFQISNTPYFSPSVLYFVNNLGGIYVSASIRGGTEYGDEWHRQTLKENRQRCFDDFISASEYLINNGYTSSEKLIWMGGSNGGLLVMACANQRPDLVKCVIGLVGVYDLLRFHKFTIGYAWKGEYGDPDDPEHMKFLTKYSPLHNVTKGKQYPAILLTAGDHDDRVVPLHTYKMIATLQYELGNEEYQKNPLMIRIDTKSGHGAGKPLTKRIEETADRYAFICNALDIKLLQQKHPSRTQIWMQCSQMS